MDFLQRAFGACGVGMNISREAPFTVQLLHEGRSAHRSGLIKIGDVIVSISGESLRVAPLPEPSSPIIRVPLQSAIPFGFVTMSGPAGEKCRTADATHARTGTIAGGAGSKPRQHGTPRVVVEVSEQVIAGPSPCRTRMHEAETKNKMRSSIINAHDPADNRTPVDGGAAAAAAAVAAR